MKKRKLLTIAGLAILGITGITFTACNEEPEDGNNVAQRVKLPTKDCVEYSRFSGDIMFADRTLHSADGMFQFTYDDDGLLIDVKFLGTIDGIDGTWQFVVVPPRDDDNTIDVYIRMDSDTYQIISEDVIRIIAINLTTEV